MSRRVGGVLVALVALLAMLAGGLITAQVASAAPGSFFPKSSRETGDGVSILASAGERTEATDYWVEFGPTTDYGQETPHQRLEAGGAADLTFAFTVAFRGSGYFRLTSATETATFTGSQNFPFTANGVSNPAPSGGPSYWPTCSDTVVTECVMSVTVDGAPTSQVQATVFMAGGGLQMMARSDHGPLVYDGGPVSDSSTVGIEVNMGTYEPAVLLGSGRFTHAEVTQTEAGNVVSFAARPLRMSSSSACRINDCGDDTMRAMLDEPGKVGLSAFPAGTWVDPAYVAASKGMWISSNASGNSTPGFDPGRRAVLINLAGPHLTAAGDVNEGYYQSFLPTAMFTDLWHISGPDELDTSVTSVGGEQTVTPRWTAVDGGWLCTMDDFHYSSPTIAFTPAGAAAPSFQPPVSSGPSQGAPDTSTGSAVGPATTGTPVVVPAAPTASNSVVPVVSTPATRTTPGISPSTSVLPAGAVLTVTYFGTPGSVLTLWARTAPATAYSRIGTVTLDAQGMATKTFSPRKNTRLMATNAAGERSAEPPVNVRSVASLRATLGAGHMASFNGAISPAVAGRLVSVYRNGVLFAQGRTNASGVYSIARRLAAGTWSFTVRTGNDASNLGATSSPVRLISR